MILPLVGQVFDCLSDVRQQLGYPNESEAEADKQRRPGHEVFFEGLDALDVGDLFAVDLDLGSGAYRGGGLRILVVGPCMRT